DSESSPDQRKQSAFSQKLPYDSCPARSQSGSHCNLSLTRRSTREQHMRDICACNQKDETDRAEQYQQGRTKIANDFVLQGSNSDISVRARILSFKPSADRCHLGSGLLERYASFQAGKDSQAEASAITLLDSQRGPDLRFRVPKWGEAEPVGHYSNNGVSHAIQLHGLANHISVSAELLLPEWIAEDYDSILPSLGFLGREVAPEQQGDAKCREHLRSHA